MQLVLIALLVAGARAVCTAGSCEEGKYCSIASKECHPMNECPTFQDAISGICPRCQRSDRCGPLFYCSSFDRLCYPNEECAIYRDAVERRCPQDETGTCTVFQAAGEKEFVTEEVDRFREAIGGVDNRNTLGSVGSGRREINWDAPVVPFLFPSQFFSLEVTRGATFRTSGDMFVSNPGADTPVKKFGPSDNLLDSLDSRNSEKFEAFSGSRIFCPFEAQSFDVTFSIPGSNEAALVNAFGVLALDVNDDESPSIKLFDGNGDSLSTYTFPSGKFSFVGVVCPDVDFSKAEVQLGKADFDVCVDDVFYGEPFVN